jgi:hypothetical protein
MPAARFLRRALPLVLAAVVAAGCTTEASTPIRKQAQAKPSPPAPKCKPKAVKASFDFERAVSSSHRSLFKQVTRQAISYFQIRPPDCEERDPIDVNVYAKGYGNVAGHARYGTIEVFAEPGSSVPSYVPERYIRGERAQLLFHEWYHVLQITLSTAPPPPTWFMEGSAEWGGFDAAVHFGYFDNMDFVRDVLRYDARRPPATLTKAKPQNPGVYSLYFTSVDFLVKEYGGKDRLRLFWQRYDPSDSWKATFRSVFKTKVSTFLKKFEAYREAGFTA